MKYRYIEFNDRTSLRVTTKDGKLYYVGRPSEELIAELELEEEKPGLYKTTLAALGEKGWELQEKLSDVPAQIGSCMNLSPEDAATLYGLLHKVLGSF